jgi:hypothetical protein
MENFINFREDSEYLNVYLGSMVYHWNQTYDRLEGVHGTLSEPNPTNRDRNYTRKWFNRKEYSKLNENHLEVNVGHVVGRNLGGLDCGINFIRQYSKINSGRYNQIEKMARKPETESIAISLKYTNQYEFTQIPNQIIFYIKQRGQIQEYTIDNPVELGNKKRDYLQKTHNISVKSSMLYQILLRERFPRNKENSSILLYNRAERVRYVKLLEELTDIDNSKENEWFSKLSTIDREVLMEMFSDLLEMGDVPSNIMLNAEKYMRMVDNNKLNDSYILFKEKQQTYC